jgi:hypothetical protein
MGLESNKSKLSLMLKRVKRFGRLMESYFQWKPFKPLLFLCQGQPIAKKRRA